MALEPSSSYDTLTLIRKIRAAIATTAPSDPALIGTKHSLATPL